MGVKPRERRLEKSFYDDLKSENGILHPLLELVKRDDTLCLEFRGDNIVIYYRGGALYTIKRGGNCYTILFDMEYCKGSIHKSEFVTDELDVRDAVKYAPFYKQQMDEWFSRNHKNEREFQQLILRENNTVHNVAKASDYYILDIEYAYKEKPGLDARFDMLAVKWKSSGAARRNNKDLKLAFIEVKYGDGAIGGASGIQKHMEDFYNFTSRQELVDEVCEDMEEVFRQKCGLGLVSGYDENATIGISREDPELVFVFANHDPDSTVIYNALKNVAINTLELKDRVFVAQASEMGYGLYAYNKAGERRFLTIEEYCKLLENGMSTSGKLKSDLQKIQ